jgi:hypothetical protein
MGGVNLGVKPPKEAALEASKLQEQNNKPCGINRIVPDLDSTINKQEEDSCLTSDLKCLS